MGLTLEHPMAVKSSISAGSSAMSAVSALERIRPMLVAIGGPRSWDDTKDHWRNRLARKVGINARRIRAILSGEKIKVSADEYLSIEARFLALGQRLEEDLRALSGASGDEASGPSGTARAPGAGGDRDHPGYARPSQSVAGR